MSKCCACFGSGRFGACGFSTDGPATTGIDRRCDRCGGTGVEPADEVAYVAALNARVRGALTASDERSAYERAMKGQ